MNQPIKISANVHHCIYFTTSRYFTPHPLISQPTKVEFKPLVIPEIGTP